MHTAKLISVAVFIVLSLAMVACQSEALSTDEGSLYGDVEALAPDGALVVYWHVLTGPDEERLLEMIDDFNASNPWDVTVVGEYQGDLEALHDKVMAGASTEQLPSMVMTEPSRAAAFAAQDIAVALPPYLESEKWGFTPAELDDFYPNALTSERLPQFKNQLFSFPCCRSLQLLYHNLDWLKELGYDVPPRTWDEFREVACAASQPASSLFGFAMGMDSSIFTSLLATQDVPLVNAGATAYTLGNEQGQAAVQFLQRLINDGCALWETEDGQIFDFSAGRVLFVIDSTAKLPTYRQAIAEEANFALALSALPHTTSDPLINAHGFSHMILRSSPKVQLAAWLFIKWLAEPAQQARWSQQRSCFPTRRSAFEEMKTYLEEYPQYAGASQLLEQEWMTEPRLTAYETCRAEIGRMLNAVTAGEDVDQWFEDTQRLCNQSLAGAD